MGSYLISLMVFLPLLGAGIQVGVNVYWARWVALSASLIGSLNAFFLIGSMQVGADLQAVESYAWVGTFAIRYDMGLDGLNVLLILLLSLLFPILIASEWNQKVGRRGMHGLFLLLQTSLFGAVCAQDLFLQFFFWGLSSLPFYFLIGIWGGEKKERVAFQLTVASSLGNLLIFLAVVLIYHSISPHTFSLAQLSGGKFLEQSFAIYGYNVSVSWTCFLLISVGLALRAPIWPLHGWYTEASEEAPASVFVALSAAVVPVSTYIFLKDCYSLFPEALTAGRSWIVGVGILNLLLGTFCGATQKDLRKLLAYLCLAEVGLILIGVGSLNSTGVIGAVFQQLILGLSIGGFGLFSGVMLDRTGHTSFLDENGNRTFGGVAVKAPFIAIFAGVMVASALGFPGLGGFVGHALVIIGGFSIHPLIVLVAAMSLMIAAYYLTSMYRYIFLGGTQALTSSFEDLTLRERAYLGPILLGVLVFGVYPKPLLVLIQPAILTLLSTLR